MAEGAVQGLPDFANPPVVEVVLGVQFRPISGFQAPHIGLLWQALRKRFPRAEVHPPLGQQTELFGGRPQPSAQVSFEFAPVPPTPRCWFLSEDHTQLIQVQQDRFIHNWRRIRPSEVYPRYPEIRSTFQGEIQDFCTFVASERLGEVEPNQCEVTYVNHIASNHGELSKVVTVWRCHFSDDFLRGPEAANLTQRHLICDSSGRPLGRLHIAVHPAFSQEDDQPIFVLTLTARGAPRGPGLPGVFAFLDLGREWVVRGFASITTQEMHTVWGRNR